MFRKVITDGDLMILHRPWWNFVGQWIPYRNLSEEVRLLKEHRDNAMSKYLSLARTYVIASKNVAEELETLQILLLDNSEAYFESKVDNSILEEREGIKYNFGHGGDKKKDSSSNKEGQSQQKQKQDSQGKPRGIPVSDLLMKGRITIQ